MKKLLLILMMLFNIISVSGQDISRHEADSLLKLLNHPTTADSTRLKSLLTLSLFNILKPGEYKADLDSADFFMHQASRLNSKVRSPEANGYLRLLTAYLSKERGDNEKLLFAKAVDVLMLTQDKYHLALADMELSKFYNSAISAELSQKGVLLEKAVTLVQESGNTEQKKFGFNELKYNYQFGGFSNKQWKLNFLNQMLKVAAQVGGSENDDWMHNELNNLQLRPDELDLAIREWLKLTVNPKAGSYPHICIIYDLLDVGYFDRGNYRNALNYAFKAIQNMKTAADSSLFLHFYYTLANIYVMLKNSDKHLESLKMILNYCILTANLGEVYMVSVDIVGNLINQHKPQEALKYMLDKQARFPPKTINEKKCLALSLGKCYAALNQNRVAERYFLEMIKYSKMQIATREITSDCLADQQIGYFYLAYGRPKKALPYLNKAFDEWPRRSNNGRILFRNHYMFKLDSLSGKYISAIRDLQRSVKFNDSTFTATKSKQIEDLQIAYETEQKKKDIAILKQNEKLQQIKLQHAENTRNWIIAGSGILLLLLGVSYNRYLLKQKSNRQLQRQREEIDQINKNLSNLLIEKDGILSQKEHLIREKEWLLKEVHHRVKNNLHTVICLLESQAAYLENDALKAIENSQHRIYAMSLIHQKLYQSDDVKTIDMSLYLPEFIQYLNESFGTQRQIRFRLDIDQLMLGVSQAIPLALIINEAVTNSIKYAFPGERNGIVEITMHQIADQITLVFADNGIGIDPAIANKPLDSLGLKLMNGLSEDINATIGFVNDKGTKITIVFNVDPLSDSNNLLTQLKEREAYS